MELQSGAGDAYDRIAALDALLYQGDDGRTAQAAAALMCDSDLGVREQAARILRRLSGAVAGSAVAPLMASSDISVRNMAGEVLVDLGPEVIDIIAPYVDDVDKDVRKFAIDVLALLPASGISDRIAARLHDSDPNVVLAAVDALAVLGAGPYLDELRALYESLPTARAGIVAAYGTLALPDIEAFLEKALIDEDPVVCLAAAEALAGCRSEDALQLLLRTAEHVHPMAQAVVLESVVNLCSLNPEWISALPEKVQTALIEMLDDPDKDYRRAAARGLSYYPDAISMAALLAHAGHDDATDIEIFRAITSFPEALDAIVEAVSARTIVPDVATTFVLALLSQGLIPEEKLALTASFLTEHYTETSEETHLAAIDICQRLQEPALDPFLIVATREQDATVSTFAFDVFASAADDWQPLDEPAPSPSGHAPLS